MTSRRVGLTAAFLALAAGGAAACDDSSTYDSPGFDEVYYDDPGSGSGFSGSGSSGSGSSGSGSSGSDSSEDDSSEVYEESDDEVFYCADEDGTIVDEDYCADGTRPSYLLWHSPYYERGLTPGQTLDGGDSFEATDRKARTAFKLPATGTVRNGTIKTNVVGSGSRAGSDSGSTGTGTSGG
jgi:hypothetical protein